MRRRFCVCAPLAAAPALIFITATHMAQTATHMAQTATHMAQTATHMAQTAAEYGVSAR